MEVIWLENGKVGCRGVEGEEIFESEKIFEQKKI